MGGVYSLPTNPDKGRSVRFNKIHSYHPQDRFTGDKNSCNMAPYGVRIVL